MQGHRLQATLPQGQKPQARCHRPHGHKAQSVRHMPQATRPQAVDYEPQATDHTCHRPQGNKPQIVHHMPQATAHENHATGHRVTSHRRTLGGKPMHLNQNGYG
eukprot:6794162-Karenia_brevis.AAC.1